MWQYTHADAHLHKNTYILLASIHTHSLTNIHTHPQRHCNLLVNAYAHAYEVRKQATCKFIRTFIYSCLHVHTSWICAQTQKVRNLANRHTHTFKHTKKLFEKHAHALYTDIFCLWTVTSTQNAYMHAQHRHVHIHTRTCTQTNKKTFLLRHKDVDTYTRTQALTCTHIMWCAQNKECYTQHRKTTWPSICFLSCS